MRRPKWEFIRIRDRGDRTVDPSEGLFFEKLPPLGAVIRESAQNSLDALLEGSDDPVRMRFSIHTGGALGRLGDLGLISRSWTGRYVNYSLTTVGKMKEEAG